MRSWDSMKRAEPTLRDLEDRARQAGRSHHAWWETWLDLTEPLSKLVGHGSGGRFTTARDYETARKGLLFAWLAPDGVPSVPPWEIPEGETEPLGPSLASIAATDTVSANRP